MRKDKLKSLDIKYFLTPFFLLALVFFMSTFLILKYHIGKRYQDFEDEALNIANSYSYNLINSKESYEIILNLLNEKLMVASQAIMLIEDNKNSETLSAIADRFSIDEIHLYNKEGEIIYSKGNKYVGWKAYEGHPVYDFMISDKELLVEEVRKDTESGVYYKYAYVKDSDGTFVQIGVMADNIQRFLEKYEIQQIINRIASRSNAMNVSFIDNNFEVIASNFSNYVGLIIEDESARKNILSLEPQTKKTVFDNHDVFQVCVPIFYGEERIGTLSVAWSTDESDAKIMEIIFTGLSIFFAVISISGIILYYAYRKNKSHLKIAYYDKLTNLPNSEYLIEYLEDEIKELENKRKAILLLNCTNFKTLNMTYGFNYGNEILKQISNNIKSILGPDDMFFRFNSDRFILVVGSYDSRNYLEELANKIIDIFKNPFTGSTELQYVNAEVGIVEIKKANTTADKLLQHATLSLSFINNNNNNICFYEERMENIARREDRIEKALRAIIKDDSSNMYLYFQPKLNVKNQKIKGFEALARLNIQELGNISPVEFIDIAEKRLLIYDIGNLILHRVCNFIKKLNDSGFGDISVAVNISGIQLLRGEFVQDITKIIESSGIDIKSLEFEITESVLLNNFDLINEKLEQIKRMGISVSLDDFGTGFSSLARFRELNVNSVKIDKHFISKIISKYDENLITADIISMSHRIGLTVVAEGVEEEAQKQYLEKHDCDIIQGYLFSKPLSELDAIEFLRENTK